MTVAMADKKADLAGPGIGNYKQLETVLPDDYRSLLTPRETQQHAVVGLRRGRLDRQRHGRQRHE